MGIIDYVRRIVGAPPPALPAAAAPQLPMQMNSAVLPVAPVGDFQRGTDGMGQRNAWARTNQRPFGVNGMASPYALSLGGFTENSRSQAAYTATTHYYANSTLNTIVEGSTAYVVGEGLTLSSKPDYLALGIAPEAAADLADQIETRFRTWAGSTAADFSARFTLHELAAMATRTFMRTGEIALRFDYRQRPGMSSRTCLHMMEPGMIDQTRTGMLGPDIGDRTLKGVVFDARGMLKGFWIIDVQLGSPVLRTAPKFVRAFTSWGRPHVGLYFDPVQAMQPRGISPLTASLTPAHEANTLQELQQAKNALQASYTAVIKSSMQTRDALNALHINDGLSMGVGAVGDHGGVPMTLQAWQKERANYYTDVKMEVSPGQVTHLFPNEELVLVESRSDNDGYTTYDKSLLRRAAAAAGVSSLLVDPDWSDVSFASSRMADELPWRHVLRRRAIVAKIYKNALRCFLEEEFDRGRIKPPKGAPEFWEAPEAYCAGTFIGSTRPVADPLKQNQADAVAIDKGLATRTEILASRGIDMEEFVRVKQLEDRLLREAGITFDNTNAPAPVETEEPDSDEPQPPSTQRGPKVV